MDLDKLEAQLEPVFLSALSWIGDHWAVVFAAAIVMGLLNGLSRASPRDRTDKRRPGER